MVLAPIFGYLVTSYLDFEPVNWYGISLILWVRWLWELNHANNKELEGKNQFDLRLTNFAYGFMTLFYVLISTRLILAYDHATYKLDWIEGALNITHSICGFYILWITSRTSQLILENREPTSSEIISHMINLILCTLVYFINTNTW